MTRKVTKEQKNYKTCKIQKKVQENIQNTKKIIR